MNRVNAFTLSPLYSNCRDSKYSEHSNNLRMAGQDLKSSQLQDDSDLILSKIAKSIAEASSSDRFFKLAGFLKTPRR